MKAVDLFEELKQNSYPGRGIAIGKTPCGKKLRIAYFIMGRSENSRNRIFVEDGEGMLVGRCGVTRLDWKNRLGELGIMVGAPYRGRGYGTEAMALLCAFCFEELNLHKLRMSVLAFNRPALRCYEANGFLGFVDKYIQPQISEKEGMMQYVNVPAVHIKGLEALGADD